MTQLPKRSSLTSKCSKHQLTFYVFLAFLFVFVVRTRNTHFWLCVRERKEREMFRAVTGIIRCHGSSLGMASGRQIGNGFAARWLRSSAVLSKRDKVGEKEKLVEKEREKNRFKEDLCIFLSFYYGQNNRNFFSSLVFRFITQSVMKPHSWPRMRSCQSFDDSQSHSTSKWKPQTSLSPLALSLSSLIV